MKKTNDLSFIEYNLIKKKHNLFKIIVEPQVYFIAHCILYVLWYINNFFQKPETTLRCNYDCFSTSSSGQKIQGETKTI